MKIKKFNESYDSYETDIVYEYGYRNYINSNIWTLLFYNVGGYVESAITFENRKDAENYILNYINYFIINEDIEEQYKPDNLFIDYEFAIDWFNDYIADSEPTLDLINTKKASNIEFDKKIKVLIDAKKYNL